MWVYPKGTATSAANVVFKYAIANGSPAAVIALHRNGATAAVIVIGAIGNVAGKHAVAHFWTACAPHINGTAIGIAPVGFKGAMGERAPAKMLVGHGATVRCFVALKVALGNGGLAVVFQINRTTKALRYLVVMKSQFSIQG